MGNESGEETDQFFDGNYLGYVTPWGVKGKEYAVNYAHKLSLISPVWYVLRNNDDEEEGIELAGAHEYDEQWIKKLKQTAKKRCTKRRGAQCSEGPKIVPRFSWEITSLTEGCLFVFQIGDMLHVC